jgi:hypothetical protein
MTHAKSCFVLVFLLTLFLLHLNISQAINMPEQSKTTLDSLNWTVNESSVERINKIKSEDVQEFINKLLGDVDNMGKLGEFKLIDLNKDKKYELLATIDYSGRAFYNTLVIVRKTNDTYEHQKLNAFNITNIDNIIIDLDDDGIKEILLTNLFGTYRGINPVPRWTDIYRWDGRKYRLASNEFPKYYEEKIVSLEKKVDELSREIKDKRIGSENLKYYQLKVEAYYIEIEKAKRLLKPKSKEGLERALRLFRSDDVDSRFDALVIFEDIGDEQSIKLLKESIKDPNPGIAAQAQMLLDKHLRKQKVTQ